MIVNSPEAIVGEPDTAPDADEAKPGATVADERDRLPHQRP
jgi:hypothetical protein